MASEYDALLESTPAQKSEYDQLLSQQPKSSVLGEIGTAVKNVAVGLVQNLVPSSLTEMVMGPLGTQALRSTEHEVQRFREAQSRIGHGEGVGQSLAETYAPNLSELASSEATRGQKIQAGVNVAAEVAPFLIPALRGMKKFGVANRSLMDIVTGGAPPKSLAETAAAEQIQKGGEISATQERVVKEGNIPKYPRDDTGRASTETGGRGGNAPSPQAEAQAPQVATAVPQPEQATIGVLNANDKISQTQAENVGVDFGIGQAQSESIGGGALTRRDVPISGTEVPYERSGVSTSQWYSAHHQKLQEFSPREVKSVDSLGTWVTSNSDLAKTLYGPNVHGVEVGQPKLLEFDGTDRSTGDFNRVLGANAEIAKKTGYISEAKILSRTLPDGFRLSELYDKLNKEGYLTPAEHSERRALQSSENASDTLLKSPKYMQAFRDYLKSEGYDGILWKNSRIDTRASDPSHDVAVIFHDKPLKVSPVSEGGAGIQPPISKEIKGKTLPTASATVTTGTGEAEAAPVPKLTARQVERYPRLASAVKGLSSGDETVPAARWNDPYASEKTHQTLENKVDAYAESLGYEKTRTENDVPIYRNRAPVSQPTETTPAVTEPTTAAPVTETGSEAVYNQFLAGKTAMERGRVEKELGKQRRAADGRVRTQKQRIEEAINSGARIEGNNLVTADGSYVDASQTGMAYARFLAEQPRYTPGNFETPLEKSKRITQAAEARQSAPIPMSQEQKVAAIDDALAEARRSKEEKARIVAEMNAAVTQRAPFPVEGVSKFKSIEIPEGYKKRGDFYVPENYTGTQPVRLAPPVSEAQPATTAQSLTKTKGGVSEEIQKAQDEGQGRQGVLAPEAATVQPPAAPPETPEELGQALKEPARIAGVSNRVLQERYAKGEIPQAPESGKGVLKEDLVRRANEIYSPERVQVAAEKVMRGEANLDDHALVTLQEEKLTKIASDAERAMKANPNDPLLRQAYDEAVANQQQWEHEVVPPMKLLAHNQMINLQGATNVDTGTLVGLQKLAWDTGKGDFTPEQKPIMNEAANRVAAAEAAEKSSIVKSDAIAQKILKPKSLFNLNELRESLQESLKTMTC